jgi:serine/threonine protein kinase
MVLESAEQFMNNFNLESTSEHYIASFALKLLEVLEYIHSMGTIHRNLRLENIFLDKGHEIADMKLGGFWPHFGAI